MHGWMRWAGTAQAQTSVILMQVILLHYDGIADSEAIPFVVEDRKLGEVYSFLKDCFIDGLWWICLNDCCSANIITLIF